MGAFEAQNNALALVKSADPLFYRAAGDVITYNYEITNIGATSVSGPFSIHDDKLGVINSCGTGLLNPGEKTSCTAPYNVTAQDMAGSTIINVAHAEDASGVTVSANVKAQVNKAVLALALKKRAVPTTYSSVGDLITYKYELKNESNVPLEAPFTVTDSKLGTITPCGNGPLAVGTTTDCIKTYAVTQADITAGSIINKAQALGGGAISTSATVTVTWQAAPAVNTTTALAASPNPSMRMQTVVLKATVTAASGTPAGKVTFLEGATALGSALLDANGVATLTLTTSIGTHDVTARYEGNSTFNPSSSNLVTQTVTKQETTFELRLLNNPAMLGTPIIFSVRLLPASQLQTGSVQFWHEGGLLGTVPLKELTDNVTGTKFRGADFSATNEITSGVHSIRVSYAGDLNFNTATSALVTQTVIGKQKATLDLHSNPNPAALGTPITLSAQVFPVSDRQIGNVTFFDNDTALGTAVLQNSCGLSGPVCKKASLTTTALPVGNHILKAIYTGDSNYTAATSAAVTQTISSAPVVTLTPITLAVASGNKAMQLNWNATNDNKVTSYRLLRHAGLNARFAPIAENWLNGLYLDKDVPTNDLVPGLTYCYQVEALRKDGTVAMTSNEACKVFGVLELFVPDMLGRPGETVIVPVNIANADGLRLAASEIWLDFNSDIIESVAVSRTALTTGYAWASAVQQDGILLPVLPMKRLKIAFFSFQPEALHGNGSLFWLTFKVKGEPGQSSPLDLKEFITNVGGSSIQDFTNLGQDVPLQVTDGLLSVVKADEGYTLGDVDGDRLIRALDALRALGMAVGKPTPTQREVRTGDINGNNHMDSADANYQPTAKQRSGTSRETPDHYPQCGYADPDRRW
jgi:hypothetical protein